MADDVTIEPPPQVTGYQTHHSYDGQWFLIVWELADGSTCQTMIPSTELLRLANQIKCAVGVLAERRAHAGDPGVC